MTKDEDQKRSEFRAGRNIGLSGREMFSFNPNLAADDEDDEEGGQTLDSRNLARDDDEDGQYKELQLDLITLEATEVGQRLYLIYYLFKVIHVIISIFSFRLMELVQLLLKIDFKKPIESIKTQ